MPDPITNEDLYGSSSSSPVTPTSHVSPQIPVEETPEIPMDTAEGTPAPAEPLKPEPPAPSHGPPPPPAKPMQSHGSPIITLFILLILFAAGIFLSRYIRPFITGSSVVHTPKTTQSPTPQPNQPTGKAGANQPPIGTPADPFANWVHYPLTSGNTVVSDLSYALPPDVTAPSCDGTACVSKGTYLPGGTRFTVAPKRMTQPLSSQHGAVITDAAGTAFTSHDATVSGHMAIEFSGTFAGSTTEGFGFTQMHGFMIEVTPTLILEINHFTPTRVAADFEKDDALFIQIISTLNFSGAPGGPGSPTTSGN